MAPAQISSYGRSRPPSAMGASARAPSANGSYAMPASGLAMPTSDLTMSTSASLFTTGSSSDHTPKTTDLSSMTLCYNCGEDGHLARKCKAPKKCFKCGEPGHSIKYCKERPVGPVRRGRTVGRGAAQSRKLGHKEGLKVTSIFDGQYEDMVNATGRAKIDETEAGAEVQAANIPDLIDLSSQPSENSDDDYDPAKSIAKVVPLYTSKQLYSKVLDGYSVDVKYQPTIQLAEPTLLDQIDEEETKEEGDADRRVEVTLHRKRKGGKGRSSTYDLTPFLSY